METLSLSYRSFIAHRSASAVARSTADFSLLLSTQQQRHTQQRTRIVTLQQNQTYPLKDPLAGLVIRPRGEAPVSRETQNRTEKSESNQKPEPEPAGKIGFMGYSLAFLSGEGLLSSPWCQSKLQPWVLSPSVTHAANATAAVYYHADREGVVGEDSSTAAEP